MGVGRLVKLVLKMNNVCDYLYTQYSVYYMWKHKMVFTVLPDYWRSQSLLFYYSQYNYSRITFLGGHHLYMYISVFMRLTVSVFVSMLVSPCYNCLVGCAEKESKSNDVQLWMSLLWCDMILLMRIKGQQSDCQTAIRSQIDTTSICTILCFCVWPLLCLLVC